MNKTQYMAELKYNVGDRVQIKSLDWFRNEGTNMVVAYMTKYYGEVVTIKSVHKGFYRIKEDGGQYCWIDEMFECKMEEETKTHNNMCKQLIDEMNPNVEVNVKTKPELKFKVGDRIYSKYHKPSNDLEIIEIVNMKDGNCAYRIKNHKTNGTYLIWRYEMSDYKLVEEESIIDLTVKGEDVKERIEIAIPEGYEYVIESGKIIFTKKKKEYPKTFEECVSVLMCKGGNRMSLELMNTFRKLIDARNAYWTIYGIENGLGKPWEPDWREKRYVIYRNQDDIIGGYREAGCVEHHIFEFPTKEMRDAFRENFGSDIEFCKEFL